ncbi:UNVERIFIED_CONTAM: Retrovirus-related Pol polyprotein from transposon TNT 1-94 [Sesamum radiatum]|uniref:Retrovirus-related Pol polyprotein from transposon TNT 1-94 n=1 Tax=Sesamum radiatum TaxID=300843 RepID=A0AAW2TIM7_SESRA
MSHGKYLSKNQSPTTPDELYRMSKIPYASAIRSIMYAMVCTRPDVSCALSMMSRFQSFPSNDHWTAVKNILKYLNRTKDYFLTYGGKYELCVKGYTDASFQADKDDYRSQSAAKEAVWIKNFISGLGVVPSVASPIKLYCDNNGAIAQAKETTSNQKSKHVERKFHLIRDIVDRKDNKVCKIVTDDNVADPLTKPMSQRKHERHLTKMGIKPIRE